MLVTPRDLIDTLADERKEVIAAYDSATDVQHALLDYLSEEDNLADLNKFSDRQVKLKSLKIFPMANGNLVDLSEVAYTSEGFSFPAVELDVVLLDDGGIQRQWRKLYTLLGVQELSRSRLIRNYILPKFIDFTVEDRQSTLIWLRDNLSQAQSENENAGNSTALIEDVRSARLITCEDGELKAPINVYQPDSKLAKSVLGNQVALPDMKVTFFSESNRWLAFFRQLDMPVEPLLNDVVEYVKAIVLDTPSTKRIESIRIVYKFIKDRLDNEIPDISDELSLALGELAEIQWIPLRQKAGDLLCFKSPEQAYTSPREAYFPRVAQLIASQSYIASLSQEPSPQVRRVMGFPEKPPLDSVISHFQALLAICENPDTMPKNSFLTKALGAIYRFFGEELGSENQDINLATTFLDIPCLWDQEKKNFWKPNHVFTGKVRYMEPWRCSIRSENETIERGYAALGRTQEPNISDWVAVLEEISDSGLPILDQKNAKVIKEVIRHIVEELNSTNESNDSVLVPTRSGSMTESRKVFMGDAPWYESSLDDWDIPVLDNSISGILGIQPTLKIPSLDESVEERLIETPINSSQENECLECDRLQGLLRSSDFISGLRRLLKHEGKEMPKMSLSYLHSIHVLCVKNIQIGLYLKDNESERFLGEDKADFYWQSNDQTAMLVENRVHYFCDDLASLLNRSLQDCLLSNLSPLVHILKRKPSEISSTLDDLKIRQFLFDSENDPVDGYDDSLNFQEFPEDGIEIQNEQEEFESFESNIAQDGFNINESQHEKKSRCDDSENARPYTDNQSKPAQSHPFSTGKYPQEEGSQEPSSRRNENPQTSTASGSSNALNKGNIDIEKGSPPNFNRSSTVGGSQSSSKQRRLVSYVVHGNEPNTKTETRSDTSNKRMAIGDKAVEIVIKYEQRHGRTARSMAHSNKGYDVISEDGETSRYIEVKGTEAAWGERGVSMSHPQFFYTLQNPEREHWLYVVENTLSQTPTLHKISNPSEIVTSFVFDGGWRQVAESVSLNTGDDEPLPSIGDKVLKEGEVVGIVKSIISFGKLTLVIYQDLDGNEKKQLLEKLNFKKGMPDG